MRREFFDLPYGNIEVKHVESNGSFIKWSPGNGLAYELLVSKLPSKIAKQIGGRYSLTLSGGGCPGMRTYVCDLGNLFTIDFVKQKWGTDIENEHMIYFAVLLNRALYDNESICDYADSAFENAGDLWPRVG